MTTGMSSLTTVARVVALSLCGVAGPASADPLAQMRQCRLISDVAPKAACYDAIVLPALGNTAPAAAAVSAAAALSAGVMVNGVVPRAMPAPASSAATAAASFGRPAPVPAPEQPGAVVAGALESSIAGLFEGWQPQSRIRLANE